MSGAGSPASTTRASSRQRGLATRFAQGSIAFNKERGTLRGLHYQAEPHAEAKLVRCIRGAVHDVIVDLRPASPTFKRWVAVELTASDGRMLYVPEGLAHGYLTLEDESETLYLISAPYAPEAARGVRWDDPAFGIEWPARAPRDVREGQGLAGLQRLSSSSRSSRTWMNRPLRRVRLAGCEPDDELARALRLDRLGAADVRRRPGGVSQALRHRCPDEPRRDREDGDPVLLRLRGQGLREAEQSGLAGRVARAVGVRPGRRAARDVHDPAAASFDHAREDRPRAVKRAEHARLEVAVPGVRIGRPDRADRVERARVVDEQVDGA